MEINFKPNPNANSCWIKEQKVNLTGKPAICYTATI